MRRFMTEIAAFIRLLGLNLVVQLRNLVEFLRVAAKYYRNFHFLQIDQSLIWAYAFRSPFKISKQFLKDKGAADIHAYGETPLTTLDFISRRAHLTENDVVFELGCGRGRTCFWLNSWIKCQVVGIEFIPDFVNIANKIKTHFHVEGVKFLQEDILDADFTGATAFYIYGTCFEDAFILKLIDKLSELPPGTKIITISYSLTEYTNKPIFEVLNRFPARFTWGEADVYYQVIKDS